MELLVRDAIAKICDVDPGAILPDAQLADIGVDSLAAAEVLVEVEIRLGRELPVDVLRRLDRANTVSDIAAQLESTFGSGASRG